VFDEVKGRLWRRSGGVEKLAVERFEVAPFHGAAALDAVRVDRLDHDALAPRFEANIPERDGFRKFWCYARSAYRLH